MNLSTHFTLDEATTSSTAVRLSINNVPNTEQLANMVSAAQQLEQVHNLLNHAMHIDSWLRVLALNKAVGGAADSAHMDGWAIDFICPEFGTPLAIVNAIIAAGIKFDQCICEGTWVHISFDPRMRQQVLTAHFIAGQPTTYSKGVINV